jgi:DNA-binding transcriptional LysR family regulator
MTLLQMKYFIAVCDNGSLTSASKSLFVTQPALSSAINQLEKEYNLKLFERKNNGLILTKEGEFFYEKAKLLLNDYDIFDKDLKDLAQNKYTIRIGVPPMIGSFLFPKIYQQYMIINPDALFEIWEEGSLSIRKKIQNKNLDIGFSILNDSSNEHYEKEYILDTELLYCVSKNNPISNKTSLTIDDIKDEKIFLLREGFFQNQLINQMYLEVEKEPKIILVSSQLSVIRNFVKMNAGGAFLMKELIDQNDDTIIGIPFLVPLTLKIGLIWQKEAELHKGAQQFIQFLRKSTKV